MNCSERLKYETRGVHQQAEKLLLEKLQAITSVDDYVKLLKLLYGYYYPVESMIAKYIDGSILTDFNIRRTANSIKNDLQALGDKTPTPVCVSVPHITNTAEALGAMYVIEGSTLGGQIIARMIREKRAVNITDAALTFFQGYKENNLLMWNRFKSYLDNMFKTETQITPLLSTATETFVKMSEWMAIAE